MIGSMYTYEKNEQFANNAGAHNSIYRGENITYLFYNGILSQQIAAGTFDDIFVGDYIIGQNSGRKYLVADINYRLNCGDTECTTPHILMIPEKIMGTEQMNTSNITTGAYVGSLMYTTNLEKYKTIIKNDFGNNHILTHRNCLMYGATNGYEINYQWYDSNIELMNECMVYGSNVFHNYLHGNNAAHFFCIDKSQLSIFTHCKNLIIAFNENNQRNPYWLRDVIDIDRFANVSGNGSSNNTYSSGTLGVRPAFLVY